MFENIRLKNVGPKNTGVNLPMTDHFAILLLSFISLFSFGHVQMVGVFIYQMQLEKLKKSYQEEQVQGWRRDLRNS